MTTYLFFYQLMLITWDLDGSFEKLNDETIDTLFDMFQSNQCPDFMGIY